jgi:hypothetical protein
MAGYRRCEKHYRDESGNRHELYFFLIGSR